MMTTSVNAPLYQQPKRTVKDVSFKSNQQNNASVHTEVSDRLRENLKLFAKNKMFGSSSSKKSSDGKDEKKN